MSHQFSRSVMSDSLWSHGLQDTRPPCPSPAPRACSNSCPLSQWCHPTISFSVIPFSSCLQSFPASGSFPGFFHVTDWFKKKKKSQNSLFIVYLELKILISRDENFYKCSFPFILMIWKSISWFLYLSRSLMHPTMWFAIKDMEYVELCIPWFSVLFGRHCSLCGTREWILDLREASNKSGSRLGSRQEVCIADHPLAELFCSMLLLLHCRGSLP